MEVCILKLCLAQTDIVWEDKSANMHKCRDIMNEAARQSADLVVFPELSLTGFTMNSGLSEAYNGETVQFFKQCTEDFGVAAAFGYACAHDGVITNRMSIADHGEITAEYDKIHPFSHGGECSVYSGGNSLCITDICGVTVGLTICYDLRFPEIYQALSGKCQLILVSANWPESRSVHWNALLKARAIENQCYIAGCNRCGSGNGLTYSGDSKVYSPDGEVLCRIMPYAEGLIYADIDKEKCSGIRAEFPLKNDRRQDLYIDFYAK